MTMISTGAFCDSSFEPGTGPRLVELDGRHLEFRPRVAGWAKAWLAVSIQPASAEAPSMAISFPLGYRAHIAR